MSQRSAGVFCIRPAVFLEMDQIKAGVTSLQTSVLHLAAFAPTSLLCVTSCNFFGIPAWCDLHSTKTFPPSSASCVRVRKCLSRGASGLCIIFLWAGRRWQYLAPPPLRQSEPPGFLPVLVSAGKFHIPIVSARIASGYAAFVPLSRLIGDSQNARRCDCRLCVVVYLWVSALW